MACRITLFDPSENKVIKTLVINDIYKIAEERVKELNEKLNEKGNKKELYWKVTTIMN